MCLMGRENFISLPQVEEEHGHQPPPTAAANSHNSVHPQTPASLCSDTSTHGQRSPLCITTVNRERYTVHHCRGVATNQ